ncbi:MAG: efflux RND transporter periplasmic adaptor subunit [Lachnospiraceae bacterium]|nr:efflux RND transporter periplasmic adaptor subunit [Lachnospiraceae bacterium]
MQKRKKYLAVSMTAIMMSSLLFTGCGSAAVEEAVDLSVAVEVTTPTTGDLTLQNEFIGTVSPEESVVVTPMVAGQVTGTFFEVGDRVNAGDTLFKIDDASAQLQLAQAQLGKANSELQAESTLTTQQQLSQLQQQASLDQINNQIATTKLALQQNDNSIDDYEDQKSDLQSAKKQAEESKNDVEAKLNSAKSLLGAFSSGATQKTIPRVYVGNYIVGGTRTEGDSIYTITAVEEQFNDDNTTKDEFKVTMELYKINGMTKSDVQSTVNSLSSTVTGLESSISSVTTSIDSVEAAIKSYATGVNSSQATLDYLNKSKQTTEQSNAMQNQQVLEDTKKSLDVASQTADVSIESAELALSYYTVTSPISGVVEAKNVDSFDMASQGMQAYTISSDNTMQVTFNVSEDIMNTLQNGQMITIDRNGTEYTASITEIQRTINAATGLFTIKASITDDNATLANGVTVKVKADTYSAKDALLVPYDAIYYDNGQAYVYLAVDGKAVKTDVETGIFNDTDMVILSGLTPDSQVITTWSPQLADGTEVKVVDPNATADETSTTGESAEVSETISTKEIVETVDVTATAAAEEESAE